MPDSPEFCVSVHRPAFLTMTLQIIILGCYPMHWVEVLDGVAQEGQLFTGLCKVEVTGEVTTTKVWFPHSLDSYMAYRK